MKALICGVNGQDGSYLAQLLLAKGYEVWGTSRDANVSAMSNLKALSVDAKVKLVSMAPNKSESVANAIRVSDPDEIYFLAGQSSVGVSFEKPAETMEGIVIGALNLLEVIRLQKKRIRFFNAGSGECFGNVSDTAANERTPFDPCSPYGVAKASSHWLVRTYRESFGIYACTGILFNHESPLRPQRFVTQKIVSAAKRIARGSTERLQLGRLDISRDWGWAPEYVDAMWRMLQQDAPQDFVIATGETNTLEQFVAATFAVNNLDWRQHVDISDALFRPTDISRSLGDPAKAAQLMGWQARYKMTDVVAMMANAVSLK